jgi:tripartite-type tricarboxylate transporter receptor subunit TctC
MERDMRSALILALTCIGLSGIGAARAQPYPTRPVTLIVPYGAGGPLDTLTRIVGERMRIPLGQSLVIENVSGASGTVGVGRAVRAAPDGYTVSVGNWPTHVVNGAMFALPYDLLRDFEPVALLSSNPYVVVARKGLPAKDLQDLIAFLKASQRYLKFSASSHLN